MEPSQHRGPNNCEIIFPDARLISRSDADTRAQVELRDYPRCLEFRRRHPLAPKIFDFNAFLETDRMLLFDSDLLFFKEPTARLQRIEDPAYRRNIFNADCHHCYTVHPDAVRDVSGLGLTPLINSGLGLVHRGSLRTDWYEEFLALPGLLGGRFWLVEEQTLIALLPFEIRRGLLPEEHAFGYAQGLKIAHSAITSAGSGRPLMYAEGVRTLVERKFPSLALRGPAGE